MRSLVCGLLLLNVTGLNAADFGRKFPYAAQINESTEVRSGPGHKFYVTGRLEPGGRVVVRRHDPGGWYMIEPPEGAFSWLPADSVQLQGQGETGVISGSNAPARVGSQFDDSSEVWQRRLSKGESVTILGQRTLNTPLGPVAMIKIAPPKGEYRWIHGSACAPAKSVRTQQQSADPFGNAQQRQPTAFRRDETQQRLPTFAKMADEATQQKADRAASPQTQQPPVDLSSFDNHEASLKQLDSRLRVMLREDPSQWNLAELKREYEQLQASSPHPAIHRQTKARLATLERYGTIQQNYEGFIRLTSAADQRDAALVATLEREYQVAKPVETAAPVAAIPATDPSTSPSFFQAEPQPAAPRPVGDPVASATGSPMPPIAADVAAPTTTPAASAALPQGPPAPSFAGAGIVERSAAAVVGTPQFVLLAPNGQILAYLEPSAKVNLEQFVGQAVGVIGDRGFDGGLQSDLIAVRSLIPVQLDTGDAIADRR